MPLYVGSGSNDFEAKSDRVGVPIETSDPNPASVGDMYFNNPSGKLRVYDGTSWADVGGATDVSGNVSGGTPYTPSLSDGIYKFNVFTGPGTLTVSNSDVVVDAVIVGGGGGAGAGGGGAGGVIARTMTLSPGSYPITVGGAGGVGPSINTAGCPGGNTVFNGQTAYGGGGGGPNGSFPKDGLPGGSGGGGVGGGAGGTGCPGQGFPGGCHSNPTNSAGASGGGFNKKGCNWNTTMGSEAGGAAGTLLWCLPTSVCGSCPNGSVSVGGGGGGYGQFGVAGDPGGGYYGRGGPSHTGPGTNQQPGLGGAVLIRYKILQ